MQAFVYTAHPARVIFGAGALAQLGAEVDRLGARRALVLSTPEQAADAAQRTEKAVAKGLSLLDNNKTQTSSTDIEILFSELTNLVDNN